MQVIALPGRRAETASWLCSLLEASGLGTEGVIRYTHWTDGNEASLATEARRLAGLNPDVVVAKSFGTNVAALAFDENQFRPGRVILIGTPYLAVSAHELTLLRRLARAIPVKFIQQAQDPGGPASQLALNLEVREDSVAAVPGNDHMYTDIRLLSAITREWLTIQQGGGNAAA
jgi:hypothetical protein